MSEDPLVSLASRALLNTVDGELDAADRAIEELGSTYGTRGLLLAALGWMDALMIVNPDLRLGNAFAVVDHAAGQRLDIDAVPRGVAWAARMIMARSRGDEDMLQALMVAPQTPEEFVESFGTLLGMVAQHLRLAGWGPR